MENQSELEIHLRKYRQELEKQLQQIGAEIQRLLREQRDIQMRIDAASSILSAEYGKRECISLDLFAGQGESSPTRSFDSMSIAEACVLVLSERNVPMSVAEIAQALQQKGFPLQSQTPERSISATLYRNRDQFRKVAPGVFAFAGSDSADNSQYAESTAKNAVGLVRGAYAVLRNQGRPMHVKEIVEALIEQGASYRTKRPRAMLSGSLRKSKQFRPCGGDVWALTEWDADVCGEES